MEKYNQKQQKLNQLSDTYRYGLSLPATSNTISISPKTTISSGSASVSLRHVDIQQLADEVEKLKEANKSLLSFIETIAHDRQRELDDIRKLINE